MTTGTGDATETMVANVLRHVYGAESVAIVDERGGRGDPFGFVDVLASTMGSSRSQTGQRAGRTMRPFGDAQVYVLLTKGSSEEEWGRESTQYLAEKGIDISKSDASDW